MDSYQYRSANADIYFLLADITDLNVDVIINFVSRKLSHKNDAIMAKGGRIVEESLKRKWNPKMVAYLTKIITPAGDLPCKTIMHTVLIDEKPGNQGYFDAIKEKISTCLEKAKQEKFQSIAFPIIYPNNIEKVYCKALDEVLSSYKQSLPKELYFVCKDKTKLRMLISEFKKLSRPMIFNDGSSPSTKKVIQMDSASSTFNEMSSRNNEFRNNTSKTSSEQEAMCQAEAAAAEPTPSDTATSEPTDSKEPCPICLCDITDCKTLKKCGHSFCSACIQHCFDSIGPTCPICQMVYGIVTGLQPRGTMRIHKDERPLPGFPNCGTYVLHYNIPGGTQEKGHPSPGSPFSGTRREAYLPANREGETVLKMLQKAFEQKLVFTIGTSRTTNQSNVVTWNDVHHKTSISGGVFNFGYPDDNYLKRVTDELEAKGITAESVADKNIVYSLVSP